MKPYHNLPPEQRRSQRLVDQYNADSRLWRKLAPKRRARRHLLRKVLPRTRLKELDQQEFAAARSPQDCIGEWIDHNLGSSQDANTLASPGTLKSFSRASIYEQ